MYYENMEELLKNFINKNSGFTTPLVSKVLDYKESVENTTLLGLKNVVKSYIVKCELISGKVKECEVNKKAFEASLTPIKWLS